MRRRIKLERGNNSGARSGGDDDAVCSYGFFSAVGFRDPQGCGVLKRGFALDVGYLALFGKLSEAAS